MSTAALRVSPAERWLWLKKRSRNHLTVPCGPLWADIVFAGALAEPAAVGCTRLEVPT